MRSATSSGVPAMQKRSASSGGVRRRASATSPRAKASLIGYRVSGKTGTAFKSIPGGYSTDRIMAVFAGLVPASHPKLATVVVIDEPSRDLHEVATLAQGGSVAAPVFSSVMSGALRLMDIAPDDLQNVPAATLVQANDSQ